MLFRSKHKLARWTGQATISKVGVFLQRAHTHMLYADVTGTDYAHYTWTKYGTSFANYSNPNGGRWSITGRDSGNLLYDSSSGRWTAPGDVSEATNYGEPINFVNGVATIKFHFYGDPVSKSSGDPADYWLKNPNARTGSTMSEPYSTGSQYYRDRISYQDSKNCYYYYPVVTLGGGSSDELGGFARGLYFNFVSLVWDL